MLSEADGVVRYGLPLCPRPTVRSAWIVLNDEEETVHV